MRKSRIRTEIIWRNLKLDLDTDTRNRRAAGYSLIDQTKVGITIAPGATIVGYDLLWRTKRVSRATLEDGFDVARGEHGDHEVVPQRLLLAQRSISPIQIYSWIITDHVKISYNDDHAVTCDILDSEGSVRKVSVNFSWTIRSNLGDIVGIECDHKSAIFEFTFLFLSQIRRSRRETNVFKEERRSDERHRDKLIRFIHRWILCIAIISLFLSSFFFSLLKIWLYWLSPWREQFSTLT